MAIWDSDNSSKWAFSASQSQEDWNWSTGSSDNFYGSSSSSGHWDSSWSSGTSSYSGWGHSLQPNLNYGQRPIVNYGYGPTASLYHGGGWGGSSAFSPSPSGQSFVNKQLLWPEKKSIFSYNAWDNAFKKK